jgi:hypothetical protein
MKRQVDPTSLRKSLLPLAGAALMLLGCSIDPVGKAPGGLEPSPSSQQSEDPDDPAGSGSGSQSDDSGDNDSGAAGGGSDGGSGSAN